MGRDEQLSDKKRPTMVDVARVAGVSLKTVSRAINNVPSVDKELAERVLQAARQLGFRRNDIAAQLRSGTRTSTIGLIIGDITNSFYSTITAAVAAVARSFNAQVITASSEEDSRVEREIALDLCARRVDGLVIVPARGDQGYLRPEIDLGIPMVFVDRPPVGLVADAYLIDNRRGATDAIRALLTEGHQRIGVVLDSLDIYTMRERLAGVENALSRLGVELVPELLATTGHDPRASAEAASRMLDLPAPPTAFFAGNNRATLGIVEELARRGRKQRLVGFDDFDLSALLPRETSLVTYDTRELGRLAAERLFARIGGFDGSAETRLLATRIWEPAVAQT